MEKVPAPEPVGFAFNLVAFLRQQLLQQPADLSIAFQDQHAHQEYLSNAGIEIGGMLRY